MAAVRSCQRAIKVNIAIMRASVNLCQIVVTQEDLRPRLDALEQKYDVNFKVVFDAIRELMTPPATERRAIGSRPRLNKGGADSQAKGPRRPTS